MDYPFHLGVTEAGDGEEGRSKSAMGIGTLLEDGIGDTIRVSLTEDAVYEIPAAYAIAGPYNARLAAPTALSLPSVRLASSTTPVPTESCNPYGYTRRVSKEVLVGPCGIGGSQPVRVELATTVPLTDIDGTWAQVQALSTPAAANAPVGEIVQLRATSQADLAALATVCQRGPATGLNPVLSLHVPMALLSTLSTLPTVAKVVTIPNSESPEATWRAEVQHTLALARQHSIVVEWALTLETIPAFLRQAHGMTLEGVAQTAGLLAHFSGQTPSQAVMLSLDVAHPVQAYRFVAAHLDNQGWALPLHLKTSALKGYDETLFQAPLQLGALLCDGIGDSLQVASDIPAVDAVRLSYNILQAARLRMSKTEFISCPSCGRTLFNLQTTTERIKSRMSHLKEVKIAIMGCIVNGPGEMADADFGYVGSGPGKISLYVGKECVERNIPDRQADERLIQLIKTQGKWVDPA
jgi:(E)-4-hydroxy-3-methylbut-2-enyl-diphosphate synthase